MAGHFAFILLLVSALWAPAAGFQPMEPTGQTPIHNPSTVIPFNGRYYVFGLIPAFLGTVTASSGWTSARFGRAFF
jgi:hypothetical protein